MSARDLSMVVSYGEWEDLQAQRELDRVEIKALCTERLRFKEEVERLEKQVKRYEKGVEEIAWHCKDTLRISRPVNEEGV